MTNRETDSGNHNVNEGKEKSMDGFDGPTPLTKDNDKADTDGIQSYAYTFIINLSVYIVNKSCHNFIYYVLYYIVNFDFT